MKKLTVYLGLLFAVISVPASASELSLQSLAFEAVEVATELAIDAVGYADISGVEMAQQAMSDAYNLMVASFESDEATILVTDSSENLDVNTQN